MPTGTTLDLGSGFREKASYETVDLTDIEDYINNTFNSNNNPELHEIYRMEDLQIFAKISDYSFYPVEFVLDPDRNIRIANKPEYQGLEFYVGSKRQFLYKRYIVESDTNRIQLDEYMKTAWNEKKFLIFLNGYLVNNNLFSFVIPSFYDEYKYKRIYCPIDLKKDDILDIYYIESDENYSKVPVAKDVRLAHKVVLADRDEQTIIRVPYPTSAYIKRKEKFLIFNEDGLFLDNRYDYGVSEDAEYVVLSHENRLMKNNVNYVTFIFPYLRSEMEEMYVNLDFNPHLSNTEFIKQYNTSFSDYTTGLLRFALPDDPKHIFSDFELNNKNTLIFGDGNLLSYDDYEIIGNGTVQLKSTAEIAVCADKTYTMCILTKKSTSLASKYSENTYFRPEAVVAEYDDQVTFPIPQIDGKYLQFMLFHKSLIFRDREQYEINDTDHTITFIKGEANIKKGDKIYFIFVNPKYSRMNGETRVGKIDFADNMEEKIKIPLDLYEFSNLSDTNTLLFINGELSDKVYTILGRDIYFGEEFKKKMSQGFSFKTKRLVEKDLYDYKGNLGLKFKTKYNFNLDDHIDLHGPILYRYILWVTPFFDTKRTVEIDRREYKTRPIPRNVIKTIDDISDENQHGPILYRYNIWSTPYFDTQRFILRNIPITRNVVYEIFEDDEESKNGPIEYNYEIWLTPYFKTQRFVMINVPITRNVVYKIYEDDEESKNGPIKYNYNIWITPYIAYPRDVIESDLIIHTKTRVIKAIELPDPNSEFIHKVTRNVVYKIFEDDEERLNGPIKYNYNIWYTPYFKTQRFILRNIPITRNVVYKIFEDDEESLNGPIEYNYEIWLTPYFDTKRFILRNIPITRNVVYKIFEDDEERLNGPIKYNYNIWYTPYFKTKRIVDPDVRKFETLPIPRNVIRVMFDINDEYNHLRAKLKFNYNVWVTPYFDTKRLVERYLYDYKGNLGLKFKTKRIVVKTIVKPPEFHTLVDPRMYSFSLIYFKDITNPDSISMYPERPQDFLDENHRIQFETEYTHPSYYHTLEFEISFSVS